MRLFHYTIPDLCVVLASGGIILSMIYDKEILKGKKVLLQNGLEAFNQSLLRAGILPVIDMYPPDLSYDELFEISRVDAMIFHFTQSKEMMKIVNASVETRRKIVITCRVVGTVSEEMTATYQSLRDADVLTVDQWGQDLIENILGSLAIAVTR